MDLLQVKNSPQNRDTFIVRKWSFFFFFLRFHRFNAVCVHTPKLFPPTQEISLSHRVFPQGPSQEPGPFQMQLEEGSATRYQRGPRGWVSLIVLLELAVDVEHLVQNQSVARASPTAPMAPRRPTVGDRFPASWRQRGPVNLLSIVARPGSG